MKNAGHVLFTMYYYYYKMPSRFGNAPRGLRAIRYTYTGSRGRNACGSGFNRTLRSGILSAGWRKDLVGLGRPSLQGCRQGELTELLNPHTNASRQLALVPSP